MMRLVGLAEAVKRRARFLGRLLPGPVRRRLSDRLFEKAMMSFPDRVFLERQVLPLLASGTYRQVLSVGVERYTAHHPTLFRQADIAFSTLEIKPENAGWGSPGAHVVGDVCDAGRHFPAGHFDAVLFNGVIGFGVNDAATADLALAAIAQVLCRGGLLVLGWNTDKGIVPQELPSVRRCFAPWRGGALPPETRFDGSTHVFDLFTRTDAA